MPILSYLAYPIKGAKEALHNDLSELGFCEAMPAENADVLILVTDTPNDEEEKRLQKKLKDLKLLQSLAMAFGHTDDEAGIN